LREIDFRQKDSIAGVEESRVLQWFVLPFGDGEQSDPERFT
jgi:hypothetical protein